MHSKVSFLASRASWPRLYAYVKYCMPFMDICVFVKLLGHWICLTLPTIWFTTHIYSCLRFKHFIYLRFKERSPNRSDKTRAWFTFGKTHPRFVWIILALRDSTLSILICVRHYLPYVWFDCALVIYFMYFLLHYLI